MAPIHVWHPAQATVPSGARIALAPVAGQRDLASRLERALLAQRPLARADIALFTADQLLQASPVRLASTAPLSSELLAIGAARAAGAQVLLHGEIIAADLALAEIPQPKKPVNMNQAFFQQKKATDGQNERLILSWRVIDVETAKTIATQSHNLRTEDAEKLYPDLAVSQENRTDMLIAASARETWKSLSPYVVKEEVRLAQPWLQPGAFTVRRGVSAARKGQWELAEKRWRWVAKWLPFNASAQHNLALAFAAREDFPAAKKQLQKAAGPLAFRLPSDTLLWIDKKHRLYNQAHGLGKPPEGWAFPEPEPNHVVDSVGTVDIATLPWWTALPLAKPPGWTWQGWLTQPWTL